VHLVVSDCTPTLLWEIPPVYILTKLPWGAFAAADAALSLSDNRRARGPGILDSGNAPKLIPYRDRR